MAKLRWTRVAVLVAGAGKEDPTSAEVSELEAQGLGGLSAVTITLSVVLAISSVMVPPVLLLNLPILVAWSAFVMWAASRNERVRVTEWSCPACGAAQGAVDRVGSLPFTRRCGACGAALEVRAAQR